MEANDNQDATPAQPALSFPAVRPSRRGFLLSGLGGAAGLGRLGAAGAAAFALGRRASAETVFPIPPQLRLRDATDLRIDRANAQLAKGWKVQTPNGDEEQYTDTRAVYGKGLPHTALGEPTNAAYAALKAALATGTPAAFDAIPQGHLRPLVNPQAALAFGLLGADQVSFAIPAAPKFNSAEKAAEMAEVYWQAITRDVPFSNYEFDPLIAEACADLSAKSDFRGPKVNGLVIPATLFRHSLTTGLVGPYISQFLWMPVPFGVSTIEQRYLMPIPGLDYGTSFTKWHDIQKGVPQGDNVLETTPRYIANGRDLGEYVHVDFSYQAYLNAALILLDIGSTTLDVNNPYLGYNNQAPFGTLGGPDVLTMVAIAAQLALKACWFQKWSVHRHLRPEAYGGRVHNHIAGAKLYDLHPDILNSSVLNRVFRKHGTYLLPLAFPEGSPTHPSYPAGHATMAGACATVLKAFFNENYVFPKPVVANASGTALLPHGGRALTVGAELSKLASNISLGRDTGGVHWRTDGVFGMALGEEVAIALLEDLRTTYNETFPGFQFTRFDGTPVTIS